ncbi:hypothetical protein ACLOJK_030630 [Asimina triloba]
MGRAPCCDKANVKKGPWSPEEDAKLKAYIEEHGTGGNWIALPPKIGLKRCGKSCRLRWLNYLRPNIKHGGFSEEEDNIICSLYISIGSRWSIIAAQLPGRTDNDIKNYWNTRLKKKLLGRRKDSQARRHSIIDDQEAKGGENGNDDCNPYSTGLSSSALERLQLHMQLQGLHSPLDFYNNPALWPKFQHQLADISAAGMTHQASFSLMKPLQLSQFNDDTPPPPIELPQPNSTAHNQKQDEVENSIHGFSSRSSSVAFENWCGAADQSLQLKQNDQDRVVLGASGSLQSEINDLIYRTSGNGDQSLYELDCLKDMIASKDNMSWWANEIEASSSPASWDSNSIVRPDHGIFQEYSLGYDL